MADTRMHINKGAVQSFIAKFLSPTYARFKIASDGTENFGFNAITLQGAASFTFTPTVSDAEIFGFLALPRKGSDDGDYAYIREGGFDGSVLSASVLDDSVSHFEVGKPYVFDVALSAAASINLAASQGSTAEMSAIMITGAIE